MDIKEDYVSAEIAKLLKEKGFKGSCNCFYERGKIVDFNNYWWRITPKERYESIQAPTLQMAMRWLREAHQLFIDIRYSVICHRFSYRIWTNESKDYDDGCFVDFIYPTYEQAAESAIKYCLENYLYRIPDGEKECECQNHTRQLSDEWQGVRIQAAIAAMQGFLSRHTYRSDLTTLAKDSVKLANYLIEELKEK